MAGAVLAAALAAGCDEPDGGRMCTAYFAIITVNVREPGGAPLDSAGVTSTLLRTGEQLSVIPFAWGTPGDYAVVDDSNLDRIRPAGDQVRFEARAGPVVASATYTIDSPDGCHVNRASGPDTLWASYLPD